MASDASSSQTTGERVAWLDQATRWLEESPELDRMMPVMAAVAGPFNRPPAAGALRGAWLGHALHPLLTDVPLGCWIGAILLDMLPGREAASRSLVGAGLAAVPVTLAAGLAEWETMERPEERRVAAVHAVGNVFAGMAFLRSWLARRAGRHGRGVSWALAGGAMALVTGYLGGHMSFAQRVGTGHRGVIGPASGIRVRLVRSKAPQP